MRRKWIGFLLAAFFLSASLWGQSETSEPTETQCRKRILAFLDVSGSMDPLVKNPQTSPFKKSLDSLEGLLSEPGFIEENDVVEIVRFGKAVDVKTKAKGPGEMRSRIQELRDNREIDLDTDFRLFFDELAKAMEESSLYDSQVILLGSDLVHEKNRYAPPGENVEDWATVQADKNETLEKIKSNSGNTTTVIFLAQYRPGHKDVQDQVLKDLQDREYLPSVKVVPSGASPQTLGEEIIFGLTRKLELALSRDKDDRNKLALILRNPNCRSLRLESMSLKTGTGADAKTKTLTVRPGEDSVEAGGRRVIKEEIPTAPGWEDLSSLTLTVKPKGGPPSDVTGTGGSWLKFKPKRGVVEGYLLWKPALRLDLDLTGHTAELDKTYDLVLRADEQGSEDPPLAMRKFSSPAGLGAESETEMRIVLPVSRSINSLLERNATFRVTIQGAQPLADGERNDVVEILSDPVANRSNAYLLIASASGALIVLFCFWQVRRLVKGFPSRKDLLRWIPVFALSLVPVVFNLIHIALLRFLSAAGVDWLAMGLSCAALVFALVWSVMKWQVSSFRKKVLSASPPMTHEQYRRSSLWGARVPWGIGIGVPLVLALIWVSSRPPVSPNLAREADPPRLRVVSE